ncbi:MAG: putative glycoside hydrolase [Treponema sp.]|nr:putative glycoside hydrolase [Treponema sp.]
MIFRVLIWLPLGFPVPAAAATQASQSPSAKWSLILGTSEGLTGLDQAGRSQTLWRGGAVRKILRSGSGSWALLSDKGILVSEDLRNWEERNQGLPVRTLKIYEDGKKSFEPVIQEIKDLEFHPQNKDIMVCAVKNGVYLTRNGGASWENLGMPPYQSNGIKAAAVLTLQDGSGKEELAVFCSHGIYGVYYYIPGKAGAKWTELNTGLERLETTDNPDEVSDIAAVFPGLLDAAAPEVYASQTFRQRLYRLNWKEKRFEQIWSDREEFGTLDSLSAGKGSLRFVRDGGIGELNFSGSAAPSMRQRQDLAEFIGTIPRNLDADPLCACFWENSRLKDSEIISLSELWLLNEPNGADPDPAKTANLEGLYLPVNHALDSGALRPYLDIMEQRSLDMVVIDMKDDYGRLRFTPKSKALEGWGRVFRPVDIDAFLQEMKARGIYTVARVVVFKDPETARKDGAKYAAWDGKTGKPWEGYYDTRRKKDPARKEEANPALTTQVLAAEDPEWEILRTWYDERWVDPYSEEIWEYITAVAVELTGRGFDEIQFDYIRFPTDGANLADVRYRWQDPGMDMDSAILSFLRHVRSRVKAPISVDIYGANGWYRTGARTGQEVELLAPWVDVICPMYYPSHFEQNFLAQDPPELRPYRIYYLGTQRTRRIARGAITVRPWVQAFYLNVSYDRMYYNTDYVRRQTEGVRGAGSGGLTYWNNSGRYEDIPVPAQ